jgi:hypothetical protein
VLTLLSRRTPLLSRIGRCTRTNSTTRCGCSQRLRSPRPGPTLTGKVRFMCGDEHDPGSGQRPMGHGHQRCSPPLTGLLLKKASAEPYRAMFSRRSGHQVAAWAWSAPATGEVIDRFGVFGPVTTINPNAGVRARSGRTAEHDCEV